MEGFWQKALWVSLPVAVAAAVTLLPGPADEVRVVAYASLALVSMAGVWAVNARARRRHAEQVDQQRWDALNARLDMGDRADRVLLRNELVRMHREWAEERGFVTLEALEYAENTYGAYHALGGNGSGTKLWEDIRALPVREVR